MFLYHKVLLMMMTDAAAAPNNLCCCHCHCRSHRLTRGRGWFRAFEWSGGVVLGDFWVGRDVRGMGRANRTRCASAATTSGLGRKLIKGLQTKFRLPKNQLKPALGALGSQKKTVQYGSKRLQIRSGNGNEKIFTRKKNRWRRSS